jgi:hypothetical protein
MISDNATTKQLPNTKIVCTISTMKYMIRNTPNDGHGVIPTHNITPTILNIIHNEDPVKDFVLKIIAQVYK